MSVSATETTTKRKQQLCSCPYLSKDCKISANLLAEILMLRPAAYIACDAALGPELSCCGFGLIPAALPKPFPGGTG